MSELVEVNGLDEIRALGVQVAARAAEFQAHAQSLASDVHGHEANQPEGNDHYGTEFRKNYYGSEDGPKSDYSSPVDEMVTSAEDQRTWGQALSSGITDFQTTDLRSRQDIQDIHAPKVEEV